MTHFQWYIQGPVRLCCTRTQAALLIQHTGTRAASTLASVLHQPPRVLERGTGKQVLEQVPVKLALQLGLLYGTYIGQQVASTKPLRIYLKNHTRELGGAYDSPESRTVIPRFVQAYNVDVSEAEQPLESYQTMNDFFTRKLKPGARPIFSPGDPRVAVMPTDSRTLVFEHVGEAMDIWIKGRGFSMACLLGRSLDNCDLEGCSLLLSRLAPEDYHRFHVPIAGKVVGIHTLGPDYYSVKPVAVQSTVNVFCANHRCVLQLNSAEFGVVFYVAVGAAEVGSINLAVGVGDVVAKGDELGWFAYGGSALITLFQRGAIAFDSDLVETSSTAVETLVRMGTSLGRAPRKKVEQRSS